MTVSVTPAPARTDRTAAAPATPATPATGGSKPLAALLVAAPLLLAGSIALHPDDTHGVERTLTALAGDSGPLWAAIHLLEPAAWLLFGFTLLLALPRLAVDRGRRLLTTAGVLSAIGFSCLAMVVYGHGEAFRFMAATDVEPSVYAPLFEQFEMGLPLAAIPSMLAKLALVLMAVGLMRCRTVPAWTGALMVVPALVLGAAGNFPMPVGMTLQFVPMVAAFVICARRIATTGGPALRSGR